MRRRRRRLAMPTVEPEKVVQVEPENTVEEKKAKKPTTKKK